MKIVNQKRPKSESSISMDRCHLAGLQSPHTLSKRLGWDLDKLIKLAADGQYRVFKHKLTGRNIQEPGPALQSLHRQLHRYLARIEAPSYLHSATKGRSYLSNARAHVGEGSIIKIDIARFYQSVPQYKVMHFFRDDLKCAPDVAGLLANIICFNGALATGSSISPIMSYYTFRHLFDDLDALAIKNGLQMTCYVDDVTMSGLNATGVILHEARTMIFRTGLRAHKDQIYPSGVAKIVTGVVVGSDKIALPFSRWKKIVKATRALENTTDTAQRLIQYPKLISRLYEASQIDSRCRARADFHQKGWRALKNMQATVK